MTRFLLIRHAHTDAVGIRLTGRANGVNLSATGLHEARRLAQLLLDVHINVLVSSPLERAVQTAQAIAEQQQHSIIASDAFTELDYGEWTDCTLDDLRRDPRFEQFNKFRSTTRIPGGEMMLEAQTRCVSALEQLCSLHPSSTVAIVTHADIIKSVVAHYTGVSLDLIHRLEISPASITVLEIFDDTARLLLLNHTGALHLQE